MPRPSLRRVSLLVLALGLTGCVGPDFVRPDPPAVGRSTAQPLPERTRATDLANGGAQTIVAGRDIPAEWWRLFRSEGLDSLVHEAISANPDLQAAEAAMRAARAATEAQRGFLFPAIQAMVSSSRSKNAGGSVSATSTASSPVATLHTVQLGMSYTPDVWGGTWRQLENQEAQEEAQRFQLEAAHLTLTAGVVNAAITEAGLRAQIDAQREIIAIGRDVLSIQRRMLALGQIAEADVTAQDAALAQAEATLPPLERQLAAQRSALATLLGRLPDNPPAQTFDLASLHLPEEVPTGLPSGLVNQRPDIRQAEANLHAAGAAVGIAIANRLPLVTLTADIGSVAGLIGDSDKGYSPTKAALFTPGTGFWALAGSLTQPLFDGFTLMYRQRQAEALLQQAEAQYRSTVISAFQNVADSLEALYFDAEALAATRTAERAADTSLAITRRQLELGAVSPLALLTAQQTAQQTRSARLVAEAARFTDTAALFQALGGGWWSRPDPAPQS